MGPLESTGTLTAVTTAVLPESKQFAFYREGVLRRLLPTVAPDARRAFRARMRRIVGNGVELVEHASDAVEAGRSAERIRGDDCDDISLDLMRRCTMATISQNGERTLHAGDFCFIDYGQPLSVIRPRHTALGIIVSRARVREVIGDEVSSLAGQPIPMRGLAAVLRQHLVTTFDEAEHMSVHERTMAADAACDMMLALLQARRGAAADVGRFATGYHQAALTIIERYCADPELAPGGIAVMLGCSRASLYRAFAQHGESVARAIWIARLDRARQLLISPAERHTFVSDIAWRCGFREPATFTRMFHRRFGFSPRDARQLSGRDCTTCEDAGNN
jgi:AraC-like DNA-binding protein